MIKKTTYEELEHEVFELKRENQSLKEGKDRFKVLSGASFEAIFLSEKGICLDQNLAAERIFGYTRTEAIGRPGTEWIAPEDRGQVKNNMLSGYDLPYQVTALRKNGTTFPCEIQGKQITYRGRPIRVTALRDITQRKRAKMELLESKERYRRIFENLQDVYYEAGIDGTVFEVSPSIEKTSLYKRKEIIGKSLYDMYTDPKNRDEFIKLILEKGRVNDYEINLKDKDGSQRPCSITTSLIRDSQGSPEKLVGSLRDISARKQAEMALLKTRDNLELRVKERTVELAKTNKKLREKIAEIKQAQREKLALERKMLYAQKLESLGVLAGGIAHDFNNILAAILGNADLALYDLPTMSPVRGNLQAIVEASKRAAEISKQMLAYSGKGQFIIEPIDAGIIIREMAHLLEVSISKNAVINYNLLDNLPTFDGDVTQIRQVIMNLITNASEAIGDKGGFITLSTGVIFCDRAYLDSVNEVLRASLDEPLPEGIYIYIEVADTGCGMDAETIGKIFDPFFTTKFTGRGLGMSAVLGIVIGHKGAIKISSDVDEGTTFTILFPANEPSDNRLAVNMNDEVGWNEWRGSGTVLIVDDEETVRAVGEQMLDRMGFSVLTASDGREALKLFSEHTEEIVCVLLDLTMPLMNGEEVFSAMRRLNPGVKVVLCSGYNEQDATQRFAGKGLAGFIQKPYGMAVLQEKLIKILHEECAAPERQGRSDI
jgi:PAS domain S-box-containing protein